MSEKRAFGLAVVFAGGAGTRMNHADNLPKQFIEVAGKPIIVYTLEHFQNHASINAIHISTNPEYIPFVKDLVLAHELTKVRGIVPGGDTAHASIVSALDSAVADSCPEDSVTLIHDGVRPMINATLIDRNIRSVLRHGNGITSIPAFETVAQSWEGSPIVEHVADRHKMHVLQAPQSFRLREIYEVNCAARVDGLVGKFVDQAHMMHHFGRRLHLVEGMRGNIKITVPLDTLFFTSLLESGEYERIVREGAR